MIGEFVLERGALVHELHKTEVAVPENREAHHVDGLEFDWHERKIDVLENGPHFPVGAKRGPHFVSDLLDAFRDALALNQGQTDVEGGD